MRLSDIESTDKFLDKVCEITPYVEQLVNDEEISKLWKDKIKANDGEVDVNKLKEMALDKGIEKIFKFIPVLLKKNRSAIYGILSVINEVEIEEIAHQKPALTISQIKELFTDKEFINLFLS